MRKKKQLLLALNAAMAFLIVWELGYFTATKNRVKLYHRTAASGGDWNSSYNLQTDRLRSSLNFPWLSYPEMPRRISRVEYLEHLDLLEAFASLMEAANVTYVIYFGTLLGSYRMHHMLPWDNDVDLAVKYEDICKVIEVIQQQSNHGTYKAFAHYLAKQSNTKTYDGVDFLHLDCTELSPENMFYNFRYCSVKDPTRSLRCHWPSLDIFFIQEDKTHAWIWDNPDAVKIERDRFYPLSRRPFGHLWLPSPRDSNYVLHTLYGNFETVCITNKPKFRGQPIHMGRIKCDKLRQYYPYVNRRSHISYTEERLMFKDELINSVIIR